MDRDLSKSLSNDGYTAAYDGSAASSNYKTRHPEFSSEKRIREVNYFISIRADKEAKN
ncbi:hypothetical protein TVAG_267670 [Trichomonas vaginalis G3]|uniref:Uncharacterized protein n=1 Tax=Trichomonas vaginalis (strain ATCC PRA-98 / G3) TaxID=412133 RepID=A2DLB7_TRIV3|nr:hypothetical protein TVAGG3_0714600 [Trichomonas vaginalis G3]EAY18735.1 hypothetical protein TVAG_267670 [Trichomonas vaginalis G3]KAI5510157.1 hypothetical protein TVAGG3_0714600 [Trichomonas vaginalis G3]|eukprot:XP_001579721.1 hypothetical protein [Trichomonas vaginalis G3]